MIPCPVCNALNRPGARFCGNCRHPLNACPQCSTANRAGAIFCHGCGHKLQVSCPGCGAVNRAQASFCHGCGASLAASSSISPPAPLTDRCPVCGSGNRPGARFCLTCGSPQILQPVSSTSRPRYGTGMLPPSTLLRDRYLLLKRIAQGGQGAVYQVSDTRLSNKVWALKEMSESAIAPGERQQAVAAFRREAELLAKLDHANLPRVVDIFEEQGKQYMVMEFIEGKTLFKLLEESSDPLPLDIVLDWAEQLCDVLGYLHSQQPPIIYRDLKPENVMEIADGSHDVKLIDFGIVRFYKAGKKKDTIRMGTPGYSPPEQYGQGQSDARTDIYALGATLHYLLTRRDPATTPFQFPSARSLNKTVPRAVSDAIARAVSKRPGDRFASMAEQSQALLGKRKRRAAAQPKPIATPIIPRPTLAPTPIATPIFPRPAPTPTPVATPIFPRPIPDPMSLLTPVLPPIQAAGPALSEDRLDFVLDKGDSASRTVHLSGGPGLTGQVQANEAWIQVSPSTLSGGSQDIEVTVSAEWLDVAQDAPASLLPTWLGRVGDRLRQASMAGWGAVIGLVLLSPLLAVGLGIAFWAHLHARHWLPRARDYKGQVQVKTNSGDQTVEVAVTVRPRKRDLALGWGKVVGAMLAELAAVGLLLLIMAG